MPVAKLHVVLALQHDRQRHQADHHHRGADDAGGRGQDRAHHRDREREPPGRPPQQDLQAVEQVGGDAGSFQHRAHEDEHRDRHQHQVVGDTPDAQRQVEELDDVEDVQRHADEAEGQPHAAQNEAHGEAREQQDRQRREHERRQIILDVHPLLLRALRGGGSSSAAPPLARAHVVTLCGGATELGRAEQLNELVQQHSDRGHAEEEHARGQEALDRPAVGQASRGVRSLVQVPGAFHEVDGEVEDDGGVGNGEDQAAQELDPALHRGAEALVHQADPYVGVPEIGEADAEQEQHRMQVPFALLQLGRAQHQEAPRDDVEDDDDHQRDRDPGADAPDPVRGRTEDVFNPQDVPHTFGLCRPAAHEGGSAGTRSAPVPAPP